MLYRRSIIKGLAGLPLGRVLADPLITQAVAAGLETVTITTKGGRSVSAALALPAKTPAPAIVLIHEWWGLNDQIKAVAAEFAREGYVALAADLYGGRVGKSPDEARALVGGVDGAATADALVSWVGWLRSNDKVNDKVATIGWCFGGGWSLNASIATPVEATVIYYGRVTPPAARLKKLKGPVQGHFGTLDRSINTKMVGGFEAEMAKAGKTPEVYWYEANHAFANPTGARYDEPDAKLAWGRTLEFLAKHLK
jgi:carboxymethylenebutenolidase